MALFALMSPGDSPGVTTTALAVTYCWGGRALLVECDPKGGNVLPGFLAGRMEGEHGGLLSLALALVHESDPAVLWDHLISLDQGAREWLLLPGLADPREIVQLDGAWEAIAEVLATATADAMDVVMDVGRIGGSDTPVQLIAAADLALMLLRPTLRQVAAAKPRLDAFRRQVGPPVPIGLCLVGAGEYGPRDISRALYDLPVIGRLPHDPQSAAVLSDGRQSRRSMRSSDLLRSASALAVAMRRHLERCRNTEEPDEVATIGEARK